MGVAFFFVLSGFSMTLGYHERVMSPDFNYKQYLTRRAIKFYPLHWMTLLANIPLTLMSVFHWWLIPLFFVNAALLQTIFPIQEVYFSFNAVSWFLSDILLFTVAFPFVFRKIIAMTKSALFIIMTAGLVVYGIIVLTSFHLPDSVMKGIVYISPFVRLFDFVFGILLGLVFLPMKQKLRTMQYPRYKGVIMKGVIMIGVIVMIALLMVESLVLSDKISLIAPLYWPLIAFLIMMAALPNKLILLENNILIRLGECSFTIFLVHRLPLRYTSKLLQIDNRVLYVLFCLVFTIALSLIVEKNILNPITQWLTKRNQQFMTARS